MIKAKHLVFTALCSYLVGCGTEQPIDQVEEKAIANLKPFSKDEMVTSAVIGSEFSESLAPQKAAYQVLIQESLKQDVPILPLNNLESEQAKVAQQVFLQAQGEQSPRYLRDPSQKQALRNEVMSVLPVLASDLNDDLKACLPKQCYNVTVYNFYHNVTIMGVVDVSKREVIKLSQQRESQPDLSPRLEVLAKAIADQEPLVKSEIARYLESGGVNIEEIEPVMVSTKSSLNNTLCERSRHLCVAPTYVLGEQALWVIVDLTEFKVAGIRWTNVGASLSNQMITERKIENEFVFESFCENLTQVQRNGWSFEYNLTSSDGIRLANIKRNGSIVLNSAKVVDWHVSYSRFEGFGYSDATGCPMFSSAVVVAHQGPSIDSIMVDGEEVGFALTQDFRQLPWPAPCNYRYQERYEFYNDGRYRVALSNHGRGCGSNGTYRPVLRLELPTETAKTGYAMQRYDAGNWLNVENEEWSLQPESALLFKNQFSHRTVDASGNGYMMAPSAGQFGDTSRGDNAYIYTTVNHADVEEGQSDLVTLGSCCNKDHQQGPELFMQPAESLQDKPLVLWYVAQMENDGTPGNEYCWAETSVVNGIAKTSTWPCTAGPMFIPYTKVSVDSGVVQ